MAITTKPMQENIQCIMASALFGYCATAEFRILTKQSKSANKRPMRPGMASTGSKKLTYKTEPFIYMAH